MRKKKKYRHLTETEVQGIKELLAANFTQVEIANMFGVARSTICNVNLGMTHDQPQ